MKIALLSVVIFVSLPVFSMEREKKRAQEEETQLTLPKGRPFDFHHYRPMRLTKKNVVSPESFIHSLSQSDRKTILQLFEKQKVAFENRLEFFSAASLAIFCKNDQLYLKDITLLLTLIKQDTEHIKFKYMRRNTDNQNPQFQIAKDSTVNKWRTEFRQAQLERLKKAYDSLSDPDKHKITRNNAIINHLHTLATIQKINAINAKTLSLNAPLVVPHHLYLGYACMQAEKHANQDTINFLNAQDTYQNRIAYQNWLNYHSVPCTK